MARTGFVNRERSTRRRGWQFLDTFSTTIGELALAAVQPDPEKRPATPQDFEDRRLAASQVKSD